MPDVLGLPLLEALARLRAAGVRRVSVADTTLGRGQDWPCVRVIRQRRCQGVIALTVCRFPADPV
jgi:beta-lactam-binding protein with PASTA domain